MNAQVPKQVLAVIPARGGSQGIPRKNLAPLGGIPLLAWTIRAAQGSHRITRVLVSTEDDEIAALARAEGAGVPFVRPQALAKGDVHSVHTVLHALAWLKEHERYEPEIVIMLLPTSPLRTAVQIDEAVALFVQHEPPSVVSVTDLGKQLLHLRRIENGVLKPLVASGDLNIQRQDSEPLYALNGSIYVTSSARLNAQKTFHQEGAIPYRMPFRSSVDINEPFDLTLAECLLQAGPSAS